MSSTEMTIDELARRVAMTSRNIREWQRQGLVPPPTRRGRVGIYTDEHIAVIERVKWLQSEGFPLDIIRRLIDSGGGPETDVRQLAAEVLNPFAGGGSATLAREALTERFGAGAEEQLARLGLLDAADEAHVTVRDPAVLDLIADLAAAGISLKPLIDSLVEVRQHQRAIATLMLDTYVAEVWQPFVESGFASPGWHAIAENATRVRPLALRLMSHLTQAALDDVAGGIMVDQAGRAGAALDATDPNPRAGETR